ncbi:MAG: 50S ribosomal protein L25/general stress protein Ctc [Gammaproteobacteria bacterium]|nr:50S ribosomal protein L25/general stress protein Ctc [Gammaproteobacteria bacterium]
MSAIKFELDASIREDLGKGASRRLRRTNQVPAVVYGAGEAATLLSLDHNKVVTALSHEAFYSHILTLKVANKGEKVILKSIQRDPSKPRIQHIDFLRVRADQKLQMHVPLHFIGDEDAPGLKEGGVISHIISDVQVSCLPADLPEFIEVDTSHLALNETLHLSHLKLPKGVELVAFSHGEEGHDLPVVSIHKPRIEVEETVEEAAEGEATEETTAEATEEAADKE